MSSSTATASVDVESAGSEEEEDCHSLIATSFIPVTGMPLLRSADSFLLPVTLEIGPPRQEHGWICQARSCFDTWHGRAGRVELKLLLDADLLAIKHLPVLNHSRPGTGSLPWPLLSLRCDGLAQAAYLPATSSCSLHQHLLLVFG